jgi:hypothetical protein
MKYIKETRAFGSSIIRYEVRIYKLRINGYFATLKEAQRSVDLALIKANLEPIYQLKKVVI